ncbi:MAG: hypothetical protein KA792_10735, partial [Bacteroidales bacterium]|nr:hypothetical protein [Bacteroidales bacterium]
MKKIISFLFISIYLILATGHLSAQELNKAYETGKLRKTSYNLEGYTDRWDNYSWDLYNLNGLYEVAKSKIESDLWQMENSIGNQLLLDELYISKGFINNLYREYKKIKTINFPLNTLDEASKLSLDNFHKEENLIIIGTDREPAVKALIKRLPENLQYRRNKAFIIEQGNRNLFVIASQTKEEADRLYKYIQITLANIEKYNILKGWTGVHSHYLLITQHTLNPYKLIDKALQSSCSFVMLSGYNDYMQIDGVNKNLKEIGFPYLFLPGQYGTGGVMYGMKTFPDVQDNTLTQCLDWSEENKGFFFANLSEAKNKEAGRFSGYIINSQADQKQLDTLNKAFITNAGRIEYKVPPAMVLFIEKNASPDQSLILKSIMDKKAVALFPQAEMAGPEDLKTTLRMLLLDEEFLENNFQPSLNLRCFVEDNKIKITVENLYNKNITGKLNFFLPQSVELKDNFNNELSLKPGEKKHIFYELKINVKACGKELPVGVSFNSPAINKTLYSLTCLDIPQVISMPSLLTATPGNIDFPITIWNFSTNEKHTVDIEVNSLTGKDFFSYSQEVSVPYWQNKQFIQSLKLKAGVYEITANTLNFEQKAKLTVNNFKSKSKDKFIANIRTEDADKDGLPEIILENSKVKATVLLFGGRVIEYILKSNGDNLLFKLYPNKPPWAGTPAGTRAFYPYGGLEEFIGYPTIEGHTVFNYEITKAEGDYLQVKVFANIHNNKIEKYITLYGNTELLEVRYAFSDMDNEIRIIGINPLIQIGKATDTSDVYYFPDKNGKIEERKPAMERYYGNTFHLKEGWVAGYDTKENISLLVGYPVN